MAQSLGRAETVLILRDGARVADALDALRTAHPQLHWPRGSMVAVNQEYVAGVEGDGEGNDRVLTQGDELAIIPPVSGG